MNVEEVFLRDVRDHPADDVPRLIYADWLTDQVAADKVARGEFIRLQCQRARLPPDDLDGPEMQAIERALQAEHQWSWLGDLAGEVERCEFHRGFVEGISLKAEAFLAHTKELFALGPIKRVNLREATSLLGLLGRCEYLASVTHLGLRESEFLAGALPDLVSSAHVGNLSVLDLSRNALGRAGAEALGRSEKLPALKSLDLDGTALGAAGLAAFFSGLSRTPGAPDRGLGARITRLHLADNSLGLEGAEVLVNRVPNTITDLDLSRNRLGAGGLTVLVGRRGYRTWNLQRLNLSGNDIAPAGAEALAISYIPRSMTSLTLNQNGLGDDGADALVAAGWSRGYLGGLRELALAGNTIGPKGIKALLGLRCLPTLTRLNLDNNLLEGEGADLIASCEALAGLTDLDVGRNRLGPAGVENLVNSPYLKKLKRLDLSGNGIGVRGVQALLAAPHLEGILELNLSGNRLDQEQVRRLRKRFGARVRA